ncbi:cell division protein FtsK [Corynebacterium bovis]|uniref:Cell division protein FtsK n=4 Tax=Corynebacterium bovis TaxID=36808 RepID=A0A426Q500_9CORY|nr:cell division protein FtsK [Corynebacterium bovis]RRO96501.1 cell division protein FtsK [Corynebacterium bovis]RRQ00611.1 cell division protein FtsK [Corynebacterium bovis]RRQ02725.1 cell division protein FtsK [Corynebacterium bovis]RRQ04122.1 cell division protein FtsK [Corynebacterium bovis]
MKVKAPPSVPQEAQPFTRLVMPVVMLVAVGGMVGAMVLSGAGRSPMTFAFPLMMVGSVIASLAPRQDVDGRRRAYHRHLGEVAEEVAESRRRQRERAAAAHPDPDVLWTLTGTGTSAPAGVVRVGVAGQAPDEPLDVAVTGSPEDLEPLCVASLRHLLDAAATVPGPVSVDLQDCACVVVTGPRGPGLVRAMQAQLALHDPAAVTVRGPHDRWLPHHGPLTVTFADGSAPVARGTVVHSPTPEWEEFARREGVFLDARDDGTLAVWASGGWRDTGRADQLSDVELELVCRRRARWEDRGSLLDLPGGDLTAPVGVVVDDGPQSGRPLTLDIRESALGGIGPHGLCIGATGSGKSEFLCTVVVSFVHHHPPEELNVVLVDFKGGAAFLGLERLPHTSAVITNLSEDAVLVDRMQDALLGEMHRRQERLHAAGLSTAAEFNRRWPGEMPALLIVVDEFSELLHARPEFADVFAAVGRLGRSLRMHLLLASQRLEEGRLRGLESHLSYRIALRKFSAQESRALIGTSAAYELPPQPGAAILAAQGHTVRFQAAYVSGPEHPRERRVVRPLGSEPEATRSTFDLVVDSLAGPCRHPVWLPPLPAELPASAVVVESEPLTAVVAREDLPFEGRQRPFTMDLRRRHWIVVGRPQSGKTTLVRAVALALSLSSPGVAVYVVDGGGALTELGRLPQVAAVAGPGLVDRVLDDVLLRMESRSPTVLLVDGLDAVGDDPRLVDIATRGLDRGTHLVVTSLRWMIRPQLRDALTGVVELAVDPAESRFRRAQAALPDVPGRGLSPEGRQIQVVTVTAQDIGHGRRVAVARGEPELRMRVLPAHLTRADLAGLVDVGRARGRHRTAGDPLLRLDGVPLGVGGPRLEPVTWDLGGHPHLTVVGEAGAGATTALRTVLRGLEAIGEDQPGSVRLLTGDVRRGLLGEPGYRSGAAWAAELEDVVETLSHRIPADLDGLTPTQVRERSWWDGPEIVLVVDDADHVDPALTGALVPLLPHARDIGLHVVQARRSGGMSRAAFTPFLQGLRDQSAWLLLSAPRDDGPVAGQQLGPRPPGRAVLVQDEAWQVQVAQP